MSSLATELSKSAWHQNEDVVLIDESQTGGILVLAKTPDQVSALGKKDRERIGIHANMIRLGGAGTDAVWKSVTTGSASEYTDFEHAVSRIYSSTSGFLTGQAGEGYQFFERVLLGRLTKQEGAPLAQPSFLQQVYSCCEEEQVDKALDLILDEVDEQLDNERFDDCDAVLASIEVSRLNLAAMLGFLTTTLVAKESLKERAGYAERVREALLQERPAGDVEDLLRRLL